MCRMINSAVRYQILRPGSAAMRSPRPSGRAHPGVGADQWGAAADLAARVCGYEITPALRACPPRGWGGSVGCGCRSSRKCRHRRPPRLPAVRPACAPFPADAGPGRRSRKCRHRRPPRLPAVRPACAPFPADAGPGRRSRPYSLVKLSNRRQIADDFGKAGRDRAAVGGGRPYSLVKLSNRRQIADDFGKAGRDRAAVGGGRP